MKAMYPKSRPARTGAAMLAAAVLFGWAMSGLANEKAAASAVATKPAATKQTATKQTVPPKQDMGPGAVVWLDSEKKIFYCAEHPNFGNTQQGYLIPEEHAKARGGRAFKGKSCS